MANSRVMALLLFITTKRGYLPDSQKENQLFTTPFYFLSFTLQRF